MDTKALSTAMASDLNGMTLADKVAAGRAAGIIPATVTSDEAACGIIMRANELGIPPMSAFSTIFPIERWDAKTRQKEIVGWGMKAEAMLACARSRIGEAKLKYEIKGDADKCIGRMSTDGGSTWNQIEWTFAMAQKAGLVIMKSGKEHSGWKNHPDAMLRARVISALTRLCTPEAILGMRTPEEEEEIRDLGQVPVVDKTPAQLVEAKLMPKVEEAPQVEAPKDEPVLDSWWPHDAGGTLEMLCNEAKISAKFLREFLETPREGKKSKAYPNGDAMTQKEFERCVAIIESIINGKEEFIRDGDGTIQLVKKTKTESKQEEIPF